MGVVFTYVGLMMGMSATAQALLVACLPKSLQYNVPFVVFGSTAAAPAQHIESEHAGEDCENAVSRSHHAAASFGQRP